jgi:hypothetical protein
MHGMLAKAKPHLTKPDPTTLYNSLPRITLPVHKSIYLQQHQNMMLNGRKPHHTSADQSRPYIASPYRA